ncbi:deoxyribose-phosphate aldolase [Bacteroidia bacterium]|nr:deoxyribose-phosphate aldolase [Bacteroidia bacterium]GHT60572.1 deoxyribose-phosphate aldolase [Bacteroidia bacterium]
MNKYEEVLGKYRLLNDEEISRKTAEIIAKSQENNTLDVLKFLYSCIDLTSLNTEDSKENIWKFVETVNDFEGSKSDMDNVAAICVYPNFVQTVKEALTADVRIASVAAGFPASQTFIEVKIAEVSLAVADGADEIDIVLNVGDFLEGNYEDLVVEIEEIKEACHNAKLKVILETGLLKTAENIKKASILSIYSGADFLKTSTGKVYPGATPEAAYVICQTIKEYNQLHNKKTGIKVSGGIRTVEDALKYYTIVKEILGKEWLAPELFRIGASSLSQNILKAL